MKTGHIEITDNKVNFVYHELPKPTKDREKFAIITGIGLMREYEASKQTVEVINYYDLHEKAIRIVDARCQFENNQPCKAKVNGKAKIIKLIK